MRTLVAKILLLALVLCPNFAAAEELVVFSGRKEPLIKPVIELFEAETGIDVTLKTGKSTALGQQILQELPNPSADVYIAKESGSLEFLRLKGAFEPYTSDATEKIPDQFKAEDGSWIGVSGRSRAVIFNKGLIDEKDVPRTLDGLLDPKFTGKVAAVNSGNESLVAWVSALRIQLGDERTREILTSLKDMDIHLLSHSHTDIRKAVGRGEYPLGLINHYYYHLQRREADPALRNVGVVYLDQGEGQRGELVNVSGAAIVKGAKHMKSAQTFIDFLVSPHAQKLFAEVNFEYPLREGVQTHAEVLDSVGCEDSSVLSCLHVMDVKLDQLGSQLESTHQMLDEVGWF